jgi:hypothetical protein
MPLSDKFTNYQKERKEILYTQETCENKKKENELIPKRFQREEDFEEDLSTFSQIEDLEVTISKSYDLINPNYYLGTENIEQETCDLSPVYKRSIRLLPTPYTKYLHESWCPSQSYYFFTCFLNSLASKYNISVDSILDTAYRCTADLGAVEKVLEGDTRNMWTQVEDLALKGVMEVRGKIEDEQQGEWGDGLEEVRYRWLVQRKGVEGVRRR